MPQVPALAPCQVCCKVLPMGVTAPMPVMTTLRRIEIPSCLYFVWGWAFKTWPDGLS